MYRFTKTFEKFFEPFMSILTTAVLFNIQGWMQRAKAALVDVRMTVCERFDWISDWKAVGCFSAVEK